VSGESGDSMPLSFKQGSHCLNCLSDPAVPEVFRRQDNEDLAFGKLICQVRVRD